MRVLESLFLGTLRGRPDDLLVYTNCLAAARVDGTVERHPRVIAEETGLSEAAVRAALQRLTRPDPEAQWPEQDGRKLVPCNDGRRWCWAVTGWQQLLTWEVHDRRRELNRQAQLRYRLRQARQAEPA